ncbi:glycoside hydrolase family 88 protein [Rubinisphaera margarita]|uniref:glycoside hydrolase family 88 protein n=1 Tax=Rubinisphaera margarita TaxID=2909586 RepID=UPI001EE79815|nr:glycoside hydrolase family 88 protein [Rubinisphaera margarita]MCG6158184.1 glycoside hydrolase family 88 protein [Rubinisphaera margarita]
MHGNLRLGFALFALAFFISNSAVPRTVIAQWLEVPIGRDNHGQPLKATVSPNGNDAAVRVLVVNAGAWIRTISVDDLPEALELSAIDLLLTKRTFPPRGTAYNDGDIAGLYFWRWLGSQGFDHVLIVGDDGHDLKKALETNAVAKMGTIPSTVVASPEHLEALLQSGNLAARHPDNAATERRKRADRTPIEVATALAAHYGRRLDSIAYIPSLAVIGRQRLGELTGNQKWNAEANAVITPWLEQDHTTNSGKVPGASTVAGYLVFVDAFDRDGEARARKIVQNVASIGIDRKTGEPVDVVPNHSEMSDSVFMDPPLLAAAGRLTGDPNYFQACLNHVRAIQKLCLRTDGIYRHSPLDQAAWGRGNGFPALGLALVLSEMPSTWPGHAELVDDFQHHLAALLPYQDATGMWHQVIDHPESYPEFSCTCMLTFAMLRGMRLGILDEEIYGEPAARGWAAIKRRIDTNGLDLTDVCTGTGKQKDLEAYFHRTAILGKDDRGGAMALMLATEQGFRDREHPAQD